MICLWCGNNLGEDRSGLFCNATHKRASKRLRKSIREGGKKDCPKPDKRQFEYRGDAARFAASQKMNFYLCECGWFHLTSHKVKKVDTDLVNQLRNRYYERK